MKNVIIYERNPEILEQICKILLSLNIYAKVSTCESREVFLQKIKTVNVDLFVMGLDQEEMEQNIGFYLTKRVREDGRFTVTPIIFVSGIRNLELYCYRTFHCYDYFCLPLDSNRFYQEMQKLLLDEFFFLRYRKLWFRHKRSMYSIPAGDIVYAETVARTLQIHTTTDCIVVPYFSMGSFLNQTGYGGIVQCHRSFVVNLNYVAGVDVRNRSVILLENRGKLDLGDYYRENVLKALWLAP